MERAAEILGSSRLGRKVCSQEHLARAVWRAAVGKRLAGHTRPTWLRGERLTVEVSDDVWAAQLEPLKAQILNKMTAIAGRPMVRDLEVAVVPRRRTMALETNAAAARQGRLALEDARDRVEDPVLARIYAGARRRATAG